MVWNAVELDWRGYHRAERGARCSFFEARAVYYGRVVVLGHLPRTAEAFPWTLQRAGIHRIFHLGRDAAHAAFERRRVAYGNGRTVTQHAGRCLPGHFPGCAFLYGLGFLTLPSP